MLPLVVLVVVLFVVVVVVFVVVAEDAAGLAAAEAAGDAAADAAGDVCVVVDVVVVDEELLCFPPEHATSADAARAAVNTMVTDLCMPCFLSRKPFAG